MFHFLHEFKNRFRDSLRHAAARRRFALIAALLSGEIARFQGLKIPELVFIELDTSRARNPNLNPNRKSKISLKPAAD